MINLDHRWCQTSGGSVTEPVGAFQDWPTEVRTTGFADWRVVNLFDLVLANISDSERTVVRVK